MRQCAAAGIDRASDAACRRLLTVTHDDGALQILRAAAAHASLLRDLVAGAKCAFQQPIKQFGGMRHAAFCGCRMRWHGASW